MGGFYLPSKFFFEFFGSPDFDGEAIEASILYSLKLRCQAFLSMAKPSKLEEFDGFAIENLKEKNLMSSTLMNRDKKRRVLFKSFEVQRILLKAIIHDMSLPKNIRFESMLRTASLPRNSSKVRLHTRCTQTGRSKAIYSKFRLSRITFRELASKGLLPGVVKASW